MCSTKEGEDPLVKMRDVLDSLSNCNSGFGFSILGISCIPPDSGHANSTNKQEDPTSAMFSPSFVNVESSTMHVGLEGEVRLPSKLISSCVSTLLIIQVHLMFPVLFRVIAAYIYIWIFCSWTYIAKKKIIFYLPFSLFALYLQNRKQFWIFMYYRLSFALYLQNRKKLAVYGLGIF